MQSHTWASRSLLNCQTCTNTIFRSLNKTKSDLKDWEGLNVSWFGSLALVKMTILPRFLYLMKTIPVHLPTTFFAMYRQACSRFIWKDSPPRIKYARLTRTKIKGGIGMPNLYKYYLACHLTRITNWHIHYDKKLWVHIENSFSRSPIHDLPWLMPKHWPTESLTHPLIHPSIPSSLHTGS